MCKLVISGGEMFTEALIFWTCVRKEVQVDFGSSFWDDLELKVEGDGKLDGMENECDKGNDCMGFMVSAVRYE
jgi:hypothetical protein